MQAIDLAPCNPVHSNLRNNSLSGPLPESIGDAARSLQELYVVSMMPRSLTCNSRLTGLFWFVLSWFGLAWLGLVWLATETWVTTL
jgi:hypothetical protein